MVEYKEVPGNAMVSTLAYQRTLLKGAEQLVRLEHTLDRLDAEGVELLGLSVKMPSEEGGEFLVVLRAVVSGQRVVGFHAASSFFETLRGALARLETGKIKWKEDEYAGE